jgi:HEPN domain-containing protein
MSANLSQQWLDKATEDLAVARLLLAGQHFSHVCFMSQQCIEKSLEGFLLAKTARHPRTHSLRDLVGECISIDPAFSPFIPDCLVVDQYYIPTRYPDGIPGGFTNLSTGDAEAKESLEAAEKIHDFVIKRM